MRRARHGTVVMAMVVALVGGLVAPPTSVVADPGGRLRNPSPSREAGPQRTPGLPGCTPSFSDVPCAHPFFTEIELLADDAIVEGLADGTYRPRATLSRQAMAVVFHRAAGEPTPPPGGWPDPGFSDIPIDHPFREAIVWFAAGGHAGGFADGTFRPTAAVTRQTMAAWVHRYAGSPTETLDDPPFSDWSPGTPFAYEIAWTASHDIVTGFGDGTFRPQSPVTRQSAAAFLRRLLDIRSSCDPLDDRHCLLPFPSDNVLRRTLDTDTGLVVDLDPAVMPDNDDGVSIDPDAWERNDGASPGASLLTHVPGVDLDQTGFTRITDMSTYDAAANPVVVIDTATGERHPVWAELDVRPASDADRLLIIRPSRNFLEGHHYVVGLRTMKDASGDAIAPDYTFVAYRDRTSTDDPAVEVRRGRMERTFQALEAAGVERGTLYLAWDFTVASERNLSERLLTMRDDAYAALAGEAPAFTLTSVEHDDAHSVTEVKGTFTVPSFTVGTGADLRLHYGADGLPEQNGTYDAAFGCVIPDAASAASPARMSLWQHGLLGTFQSAIDDTDDFANVVNIVFCGVSWIGMSTEDLPTVAAIMTDLSDFAALPDRAQQGILDTQLLAYLMKHPDGLGSDPNFQDGGLPLIDPSEVVFIGGSQGGIMGGAATATSKEWERAFLAVPGMNFSTMLHRSIYWAQLIQPVLNYSDPLEQPLGLAFIQMLWDRSESNGYAHHLAGDPYPGTPEHDVILFEAFGDHQVANLATETMARTIGIPMRTPALDPGRSNVTVPFWDIPAVPSYPHAGSALVVWDWGEPPDYDTSPPPLTNLPPGGGGDVDPHARAASEPLVLAMASAFLTSGLVVDVCAGAPCVSP